MDKGKAELIRFEQTVLSQDREMNDAEYKEWVALKKKVSLVREDIKKDVMDKLNRNERIAVFQALLRYPK